MPAPRRATKRGTFGGPVSGHDVDRDEQARTLIAAAPVELVERDGRTSRCGVSRVANARTSRACRFARGLGATPVRRRLTRPVPPVPCVALARSNDEEEAAAQAVQRVVGGTWTVLDTGASPSQVDVLHTLDDGTTLAVEVTSDGESDLRESRSAIQKRSGEFVGSTLTHMWLVSVPASTLVSSLQPALEETLREVERQGLPMASSRDADVRFCGPVARALRRLGVDSVIRWNEHPPAGEPKIIVSTSWSVIGKPESLPDAIARVLARTDNQDKLAAVDADARHLYLLLRDHAAGSGLMGLWPLQECPPDPRGVLDALWIFAPWASAFLHRVVPGTDRWEHFEMATGRPAPESALSMKA